MSAPRDMRIALLDDEPANLLLLQRILRDANYSDVLSFSDPQELLALFPGQRPDLLLLDLHMPGLDGLQVLELVHRQLEDEEFLPVLVLTGDVSDTARERALSCGASDFLIKPLNHTEVLLRVRNLLQTRALHQRLRARGEALAGELQASRAAEQEKAVVQEEIRRRLDRVLTDGGITMVFQPIVELASGRVTGAEALARFTVEPRRTPDAWFAEAASVGLSVELELTAALAALRQFDRLPDRAYLSLNLSPDTLLAVHPDTLLGTVDPARLVVELTEHAVVHDYPALQAALDVLRSRGVRVAVDDAGAGFASLKHVLQLSPDIIKLDLAFIRDVDTDPVKRALCTAFVSIANEIGARLVGEGVETEAEREALVRLGVDHGQGYLLGRPGPVDELQPARV